MPIRARQAERFELPVIVVYPAGYLQAIIHAEGLEQQGVEIGGKRTVKVSYIAVEDLTKR